MISSTALCPVVNWYGKLQLVSELLMIEKLSDDEIIFLFRSPNFSAYTFLGSKIHIFIKITLKGKY